MNDRTALPRDTEGAEASRETQVVALLDEYVTALQAADAERQVALLAEHPHLAELARCLSALDSLAPAPREPAIHNRAELLTDDAPRRFGKYELLGEAGRGGMGVVYKAWQTDLGRTVALKMILSSQFASEDEVRRFYHEAQAAGRLRHPHIVAVHEAGQTAGQHYFAMDYVDGPSLAQRLKEGPLDPDEGAACLAQVARAVDYLHGHRIIHRDLKPSNILLDATGRPAVTDFGLAKVFDCEDAGHTRTGTILGTPSYMAPEQAAGKTSDISPQSDVYSLGAILYEMLTGRPPFQEANPLDTLVQVLEGEPTLPGRLNGRVPHELEVICLRCLEKSPERRYPTAAALADDLERYLRDEPIEARYAGRVRRLTRWARREPALVSRLAGLVVAGSIVHVKFLISGTDHVMHRQVMLLLLAWALVCWGCQMLLRRERSAQVGRYLWSAADLVLLTSLLVVVGGVLGPLLVGYPLLIVASGLFFQKRLVCFTTAVAVGGYVALLLLRPDPGGEPHYPVLFASVLALIGGIVAYQVQRVRALSRYYECRRVL